MFVFDLLKSMTKYIVDATDDKTVAKWSRIKFGVIFHRPSLYFKCRGPRRFKVNGPIALLIVQQKDTIDEVVVKRTSCHSHKQKNKTTKQIK